MSLFFLFSQDSQLLLLRLPLLVLFLVLVLLDHVVVVVVVVVDVLSLLFHYLTISFLISLKSKCDLNRDCCDSSDERRSTCKDYDRCTFESGDLCGWDQVNDDQMDFVIKAGELNLILQKTKNKLALFVSGAALLPC